ncbi:MAG: sulfatase-like hydrolase/transferase [Opitutia bacterium]
MPLRLLPLLSLLALPFSFAASPSSATSAPSESSATLRKPNILVIIADDLGIGDVGFSGGKDFPTPHIDRLAREGASFTAGYLTAPVCSPSRAGYLSGRYQQRFGHEFNPAVGNVEQMGLPLSEKLLPARLREAGYRTAMVGKWHLGTAKEFQPLARGFDEQLLGFLGGARDYHGEVRGPSRALLRNGQPAEAKGYLTDQFGDEGAAFVSSQKGAAKPWFLYMAFNASHTPMDTTPETLARVPASVPAARRKIAAMTLSLDDNIGKLLKALDATGQADNTIVVFTSDNGGAPASNASNLHLRGSKGNTFEGGIRTPMAVRWPRVAKPGSTLAAPTNTLDLTATFLAAATGSVPKDYDGRDLAPALAGQATPDPTRPLFWRMGTNWAIRSGDWKLVGGKEGRGPNAKTVTLLVNLKSDPSEKTDLSAQHPDKRKELEAAFKAWEKTLAKPLWKGGPGSGVGNEIGA